MSGIEGQGKLGLVELREHLGEIGHPAAGWTPGGMFSTQIMTLVPIGVLCQHHQTPRQRLAPPDRSSAASDSPPGWTTRHVPPAARSQSTQRFRSSTDSWWTDGSVAPRSTRRARMVCPPQQPWALWIDRPRSAALLGGPKLGSGKTTPLRQDLQHARAESDGQAELVVEVDIGDSRTSPWCREVFRPQCLSLKRVPSSGSSKVTSPLVEVAGGSHHSNGAIAHNRHLRDDHAGIGRRAGRLGAMTADVRPDRTQVFAPTDASSAAGKSRKDPRACRQRP